MKLINVLILALIFASAFSYAGKKKKNTNQNPCQLQVLNELTGREVSQNISFSFEDKIKSLPCYKNNECRSSLAELGPGMKEIGGRSRHGESLVEHIVDLFENPGMKNLQAEVQDLFKHCLKLKTLCKEEQIEGILKLQSTEFPFKPLSHFYYQFIESIGRIGKDADTDHLSTLITQQSKPGSGSIHGEFSGVSFDGKNYIVNGDILPEENLDSFIGLYREDITFKLLERLGYKVDILPDSDEQRIAQGIQEKFKNLSQIDQLNEVKNPDLILNDRFIADIYSPLYPLKEDRIDNVTKGILSKSERTKYTPKRKNAIFQSKKHGQRQTNRVIVYIDSYQGNISNMAKKIRENINKYHPEYLEEAIILYEKNNSPQMINVWP